MSKANPTSLRLGMQAMLDGRRFTVKGRVVLSMEADDGETYYWNEFNLVDTNGAAATLVFEETEKGPTWKWFVMFEPRVPLTASEAATKRRGDTVNFEGRPVHITLVDETRVEHIEGEAPEGVEVGDRANYFNADAGDRVLVASWTGEEIEFYQGRDLPNGRVETAFNLPRSQSSSAGYRSDWSSSGGESSQNWQAYLKYAIYAVVAAVFFFVHVDWQDEPPPPPYRAPEPPPKQAAKASPLKVGAQGQLAGHRYTISGHALLEVARVGKRFDRHEYVLREDDGTTVLLVNSLGGEEAEWHVLSPVAAPPSFGAYDAAALRQGRSAMLGIQMVQVTQLFMGRVRSVDGLVTSDWWPQELHYGLIARQADKWLVARWTEGKFQLYEGRMLPAAEIMVRLGR